MGTDPDSGHWHQADTVTWTAIMATIVVILLTGLADLRKQVQASQPAALPKPALRQLTVIDGYDPVATYDPADRILTITNHLPADALVCISGRCGLPREWEQAVPEHWKGGR